jgi:AAA family ATP:ADP antiporter
MRQARSLVRLHSTAIAAACTVDLPMDSRARARLGVTVSAAVTFGLLLTSYSALRPVRDSLVAEGNLDDLPLVFLGTFIAVSVVSPVWSALLANRSRRRFVAMAFHAFAASEIAFVLAARAAPASIVVGRAFYIWLAVFSLFVVSVFWSLLNDLLGPATARRLYGPIAAGGTVGTFLGPLLTNRLVETIGETGMLVASAALLELAVVGVYLLRRAAAKLEPIDGAAEEPDAPAGGGAFTGIAQVTRSRYLTAIAGYVLCTACAATFLYLTQQQLVKAAHLERAARTQYFATIDMWVAAIAFVLQTVITARALRWFGPGVVLAVLPIVQAVGISVLTFAPSLGSLAAVQAIGRAATHGLTRPSRELLFTVIPRDEKYRAKNAIDTVGYRFGDVGSSWLFKGLVAIGSGAVAIATIPLVAIWLVMAAMAGIGFRRRVAAHAAQKELT